MFINCISYRLYHDFASNDLKINLKIKEYDLNKSQLYCLHYYLFFSGVELYSIS